MLGPYTTNDQVRAIFGVSAEEIADMTLDLPLYQKNLELELDDVSPTLRADYTTVATILPGALTAVQQAFLDGVTLFAPYAVGKQITTGLPLFAAKQVTDGKAGVTRNSDSPFQQQVSDCKKFYERFRQSLEKRYAAYKTTSAPDEIGAPKMFAISSPSSDPVAGT